MKTRNGLIDIQEAHQQLIIFRFHTVDWINKYSKTNPLICRSFDGGSNCHCITHLEEKSSVTSLNASLFISRDYFKTPICLLVNFPARDQECTWACAAYFEWCDYNLNAFGVLIQQWIYNGKWMCNKPLTSNSKSTESNSAVLRPSSVATNVFRRTDLLFH